MSNPTEEDWEAVMQIFGYLKKTKDLGISYHVKHVGKLNINGYADADFAADYLDRKSRTGYIIFLNDCPIIWKSRKQRSVAISTMESEYMSASDATQDLIWVTQVLNELDLEEQVTCSLNMDNQAAIKIAENAESNHRSKHIDIRYHFIREKVKENKVKLIFTPTAEMIADTLTKPLPRPLFEKLRTMTGVTEKDLLGES